MVLFTEPSEDLCRICALPSAILVGKLKPQSNGDWYTGRWWVGCYIWYCECEEGPGWVAAPPTPLQGPVSQLHIIRCGTIITVPVPIKGFTPFTVMRFSYWLQAESEVIQLNRGYTDAYCVTVLNKCVVSCFVFVISFNSTIRPAQVSLKVYDCVQLNSCFVLLSSWWSTMIVINIDSLMRGALCSKLHHPPSQLLFTQQQSSIDSQLFVENRHFCLPHLLRRPR